MAANCDYVYLEGLRFKTGNIKVSVPVNTPEEGPVDRRALQYRRYKLAKPDNRSASMTEDTITVEMLKKIVGRGETVPCRVTGEDGEYLTGLQLDPFRCEGRSGRRAFSAENLSETLHTKRFRVAREQIRTLPYGRREARGAVERLTWAIRSMPDGEVGAMVLSGDAPNLPGLLTRDRVLKLFERRGDDITLILAAMPTLRASLDLSEEEANKIEEALTNFAKQLFAELPSFKRHVTGKTTGPLDSVTDPATLRKIALLAAAEHPGKESWGATVGDPRDVVLDALWRLGRMRELVEYDAGQRRYESLGAEYSRNLAYDTVFGAASLSEIRDRIAAETATVLASLRDHETIAQALSSPTISSAAFAAIGEDEVRRLIGIVRSSGDVDAVSRIAASADDRVKALLV